MSRNLVHELYRLAWPVLIAQLAVMAYAVIDTLMAGQYATADLAAVGIGASIYFSVFVALMGVLLAVSPIVAQLYGAQRYAAIGEQVRQGAWLAVALAVLSVFVFRYPEPFLALSRTTPDVSEKVREYLALAAWGVPAGLGFRLFAGFSTAVSRPRFMMVLNLTGLAMKIPLNWVFMYGHLGAPEMGAAGCALATTITNWFVCVLAWVWCGMSADYRRYAVYSHWSWPNWKHQRHLIALGVPMGMTFLVDVTAFTFMALFIARLGPVNSAAHQIAANLAAVIFMLPLALGNAAGVLVGQAVGAKDYVRARATGQTGILVALLLACVTAVLLATGSGLVAAFYTPDESVRKVAATLLTLVACYHLGDGLQVVTVNVLRGYKKAVVPLLVNAMGLWGIGLAGGYMLGLTDVFRIDALGWHSPFGAPGFWVAAIAGMWISGAGIALYFLVVSKAASRG